MEGVFHNQCGHGKRHIMAIFGQLEWLHVVAEEPVHPHAKQRWLVVVVLHVGQENLEPAEEDWLCWGMRQQKIWWNFLAVDGVVVGVVGNVGGQLSLCCVCCFNQI